MARLLSPVELAEVRARSAAAASPRREAIMDTVRNELDRHGDMTRLANYTGLSPSCLRNLRNGQTRWPRDVTMLTVTHALGLELRLVRKT